MADDRLRFKDFVLECDSGELLHDGRRVALQPQPAKVLERLARRSGQVVPREELYELLWDDGRYVDRDLGLNQCVRQVRKALGDDAQEPRFIETVPRRGYRFLAPVEMEAKRADVRVEEPPPEGPKRAGGWRWAVAAALVALVAWSVIDRSAASGELPERLAVLPIQNLSGEAGYDALGRKLAEALASRSAGALAGHVEVAARSASRDLDYEALSAGEMGREAGARWLLKACFLETDDTLQASVQLIDASSETLAWSHERALDPDEWSQWTDEVVRALARRLQVPSEAGWASPARRGTQAAELNPVPAAVRP